MDSFISVLLSHLKGEVDLHYNIVTPVALLVSNSLIMYMLQHYITSPIEEILTITAITVGIPTEVSRLYFGYSGNLREQVRSLEQFAYYFHGV